MDTTAFKKPFNNVFESKGVEISFSGQPSRMFTTLEGKANQKICLWGTFTADDLVQGEYGPGGLRADAPFVPGGKRMKDGLLTSLALLTIEAVQKDLVDNTECRKKDGSIYANRNIICVYMDGAYKNGDYYVLKAKSGKNNDIVLELKKEKINEFRLEPDGISSTEFNERYGNYIV